MKNFSLNSDMLRKSDDLYFFISKEIYENWKGILPVWILTYDLFFSNLNFFIYFKNFNHVITCELLLEEEMKLRPIVSDREFPGFLNTRLGLEFWDLFLGMARGSTQNSKVSLVPLSLTLIGISLRQLNSPQNWKKIIKTPTFIA